MTARALRLAAFLGAMLSLMSCSQSHNDRLAQAHASGTIRIGITGTSPPWTTFDANHQPAGYDVAVAKEIARRLGIAHPVFVPDAFKSLVEGLKADKYDLVLNDLTPTPAREQQLDFAQPYGVEDFRIFVAKENATIHGTADLKGARVGVTTGTSNESWARAHLPGADIRGYDNGSLIFRDLALGRLDAVIISHFGGLKYAHANQQPVKEVGPPLTFQLSAPAMAKGQDHLKSAVNAAIADMTRSGAIDRLAAEWVGVNYVMSAAIGQGKQEAAADVRAAPSPETSSGLHDLISRSLPLLGPALLTTISLGFTAFILGSVLGLLIALARLSKLRPLRWLGLAYVSVFRGTPLLVQILLIYFGLPQLGLKLGPLPAAILALTQFSAAYLSENFRAGIMAVDKGQWEAATSMGMGYWMTLWRVVLPQGFRIALPSIGSRLIALMKDTSLASVITVVELTRVADEVGATTFRYVEAFTMVGLIYWFLNQILTVVQLGIETRLSRHMR